MLYAGSNTSGTSSSVTAKNENSFPMSLGGHNFDSMDLATTAIVPFIMSIVGAI